MINEYESGDVIPQHTDSVSLSSTGPADDLNSGTVATLTLDAAGVFTLS